MDRIRNHALQIATPTVMNKMELNVLLTRWDDEGDHAGAVAPGRLQGLDQLLHLPDLHIFVRLEINTHKK